MDIKKVKKVEKDEISSTLKYTRVFILFGLIIALIAVLFFTLG